MNSEPPREMELTVSNEHAEEKIGNCTFLDQPKYKQRKVSAVRDFPEGCGPFASRIDPFLDLDVVDFGHANDAIVEDKSGKHSGGDTVSPKHDNDPQHSEFKKDLFHTETIGQSSDCSLKNENPVVSPHQVNGPTLAIVEPAEVALVGMEIVDAEDCSLQKKNPMVKSSPVNAPTLANEEPVKFALVGMETLDTEFATEDPIKEQDFSYTPKSSFPVGEVAMPDDSESPSPAAVRMYPPRRKVSAVRDFPHFFG